MTEPDVREIIKEFIAYKNMYIAEFEKHCNLSNGAISKMGDRPRKSTIEKITDTFPDFESFKENFKKKEMALTITEETMLQQANAIMDKALSMFNMVTEIIEKTTESNNELLKAYNRVSDLYTRLEKKHDNMYEQNSEMFKNLSMQVNEKIDALLQDILKECRTLELPEHLKG